LLKREGTAWDVAYGTTFQFQIRVDMLSAILCFAGHEAKWVTGVILPVNAGTTAGSTDRPALIEDKPKL
jgi:hypothetical protein